MLGIPFFWMLGLLLLVLFAYRFATRMKGKSGNGESGGAEESEAETQYRQRRNMAMLGAFSGLMAKVAKADGHIGDSEIRAIETLFQRIGLDDAQREHCIRSFRAAKDDNLSAQIYATKLRDATSSRDVRVFLYEMLWELASADGVISPAEEAILASIPYQLEINPAYFEYCRNRYMFFRQFNGGGDRRNAGRGGGASRGAADSLEAAYATLGVLPSATDDEVKKAYRAAAKKYHPDLLRAQGLSDELISKAQEKMAAINDAWALIRKSRNTL